VDEKATTPSLLNASLSAVRRAPVADLQATGVERLNEIVQPLKTIRSFCVADSSNFAIVPAFENKTADMCRTSACPKKSVGTTLSPTTWSLNFFSTPYLLPSSP
jgi:stage V sporulation protein SpoVS